MACLLSLLPGLLLTVLLGALGTQGYAGYCYVSTIPKPCTWSDFTSSQFTAAALVGLSLMVFGFPLNMAIFYLRWRVVVI